jgi:hypothetical protein
LFNWVVVAVDVSALSLAVSRFNWVVVAVDVSALSLAVSRFNWSQLLALLRKGRYQ